MANLQIKGMDDSLYERLKSMASSQNRSVSQQVLFLVRSHLAKGASVDEKKTSAQVLLELSGSWNDSRAPREIIEDIKKGRRNSKKLHRGF